MMRKIIVLSMISLDGVIQAPGQKDEDLSDGFKFGGWVAPYSDEAYNRAVRKETEPAEYLLGRKTFEIWEEYWPKHANQWPGINDGAKYVLSRTRTNSDWKNSVFITDVDAIKKIKATHGPDIQVWGSSELVHLLMKHDLVDELRLKIHPLVLGNGKKLFDGGGHPAAFELSDSQTTTTGVILASYKRGGDIQTGDLG